ncbi:MAG: hybrid sensor histidine kinase/response regulator [Caldilineaceae bacterium]|nr:hybrid sensor histidine kinase/response regulator [Caldilineaceae bacterium]
MATENANLVNALRIPQVRWIFFAALLIGVVQALFATVVPEQVTPLTIMSNYVDVLLVATALAALALHNVHYRLSIWTFTIGCHGIVLLAHLGWPMSSGIMLVALLIGVVCWFIGGPSGLLFAILDSALALLLVQWQLLLAVDYLTLLLLIWGTILLYWTAVEPTNVLVAWSQDYYVRARNKAEEAISSKAELALALDDLAEANRQLVYLNRMVRAAQGESEKASRARIEFVANVSHELRTPLNMIIGFSEVLLEAPRLYGTDLPRTLIADIAAIHRNGQHLQKLIDDVLDLSQIDMRRMALSKERTDLATLIHEAMEAVRYLFESKGLELNTNIPLDLPHIVCDRTRIREVLLNLLSNAGRFTEHGGTTVSVQVNEERVTIAVSDTGPGIARDQLGQIFEPFQQLDGIIRSHFRGSGLGLAISRAFIEMHGGRMWIESEIGQGSVLSFDLPRPPSEIPQHVTAGLAGRYVELRARPPRAPAVEHRPRLAVLGNDLLLQRLFARYLPQADVVLSDTLPQMVDVHENYPYQAVIANAADPEQIRLLLEQRHLLPSYVPLLITLFADPAGIQLLGVSDYLVKPLSRQRLLAALNELPQPVQHILVADDDPDIHHLLNRMLAFDAATGYQLLQASNGQEALHIMRLRQPDVVLLDLGMPLLDGYQVLEEKNQDLTIRNIPVFVFSARDISEEPLTSLAIVATKKDGLTVPEVLDSVMELNRILGLLPITDGPMRQETSPG